MRAGAAVIVFARAPQPGQVKTRLAPRLGEWGAARLQRRLVRRTLRVAQASRCGPVELHGTPRARQAFFLQCAREWGVALRGQRGRDLGERMLRALEGGLRAHRAVILVGSDCPVLEARDLRRAARALAGGCDAVLAPAEDGGYPLIGLRHVSPRLFEHIAWSGPDVFARTAEALDLLGWRWRRLRTLWDVDRPEDLARLAESPLHLRSGNRREARHR
ncbi:MAG TPA: TIGR04282 family arsenosugar biosynthesis glycosyltransferase [Burkholderiales bacterium]|nr:TIGR04282 family arsenosugar biosynthesis glycosyltransferase [Burkholderiales bacterium]